jgi:hypothetical protein
MLTNSNSLNERFRTFETRLTNKTRANKKFVIIIKIFILWTKTLINQKKLRIKGIITGFETRLSNQKIEQNKEVSNIFFLT